MMRIAPTSALPNLETTAGRRDPIVRKSLIMRLIDAFASADRRHRDRREIERMDDHRLKDIGRTREQMNQMIYDAYGMRPADQKPTPISSGRSVW